MFSCFFQFLSSGGFKINATTSTDPPHPHKFLKYRSRSRVGWFVVIYRGFAKCTHLHINNIENVLLMSEYFWSTFCSSGEYFWTTFEYFSSTFPSRDFKRFPFERQGKVRAFEYFSSTCPSKVFTSMSPTLDVKRSKSCCCDFY